MGPFFTFIIGLPAVIAVFWYFGARVDWYGLVGLGAFLLLVIGISTYEEFFG